MRSFAVFAVCVLAGCISSPGGSEQPEGSDGGTFSAELEHSRTVETSYAEPVNQTVLSLEVELADRAYVNVFGSSAVETEYWEETEITEWLRVDTDVFRVARSYGDYREAGTENGFARYSSSWRTSWNEMFELDAGEHVIEYVVAAQHTNQGDYAAGSDPVMTTAELTARVTQ